VKIFIDTAEKLSTTFILYLAKDVYPRLSWLKTVRNALHRSNKGLLAINSANLYGCIAAYNLMRAVWARTLHGETLLFAGYRGRVADR
jgi:hypothetical protein